MLFQFLIKNSVMVGEDVVISDSLVTRDTSSWTSGGGGARTLGLGGGEGLAHGCSSGI